MNKRILAILAATGASTIYGINHTIAKGVMPTYIEPSGFILLRVLGAAVLFWIISFFTKNEKISTSDWLRIVVCSFFGMVVNMQFFFIGLSLSTPINSSVIITVTPVLVLILAAFLIKEKITLLKTVGIFIGLGGALALIFFSNSTAVNAPNIPLGNLFFIINAFSYGLYLIIVKPLVAKYHAITLMKWLFLFAVIINFPFSISQFSHVVWAGLPWDGVWKFSFVVLGTTFATYLLNIFALKELSPTTMSSFIYIQPLIAIIFAVITGADRLTTLKIIAAVLVFIGVYLVTKKKSPKAREAIDL